MSQTTSKVFLTVNEAALRKSLRHSFANFDTCVQELLQNARRAGATQIDVSYDVQTHTLTIADDGVGISDFETMLCIGGSGWSDDIAQIEKPYGMGFLSAIYAAREVVIESQGQVLRFKSEDALDKQALSIHQAEPDHAVTRGARVTLVGFDWPSADTTIVRMVQGFGVDVCFNGQVLPRPDALTASAQKIDAGHVMLRAETFDHRDTRVYLQGFMVQQSRSINHTTNVVHLDSSKYFGKLPDRDRVINQDLVIRDVDLQIKALFVERLFARKAEQPAFQFCVENRPLAVSVGRLDVFNDIDLIPAAWLEVASDLPFDCNGVDRFTGAYTGAEFITRQQLEVGERQIADLEAFSAAENLASEFINQSWLYVFAKQMPVLSEFVHHEHWVHDLVSVGNDTEAKIGWDDIQHQARFDGERATWLRGLDVIVAGQVWVEVDGDRAPLEDAVYDPVTSTLLVPKTGTGVAWVGSYTLRQINDYWIDDELQEDCLDKDEDVINDFVRQLVADGPEERARLALQAVLRNYRALNGKRFTVSIDHGGEIMVSDLVELAPPVEEAAEA